MWRLFARLTLQWLLLLLLLILPGTNPTTFDIIPVQDEAEVQVTAYDNLLESFHTNYTDFKFEYIFIIGGICQDLWQDDPVDWYSKWAKAGDETINVTEILCADEDIFENGYNKEFHLDALDKVQDLVGDRLHETLVITVAVGLESDWTPVANLIQRGMAFFHAKEDPHDFNITEFGLSPNTSLYFYFQWDESAAARTAGRELCRQYKGTPQLKIARMYEPGRNDSLNFRVDDALEVFKEECNETEIIDLWKVYGDISNQSLKALLTFNRVPDLLLTCRDAQAKFFLDAAQDVLPANEFKRLATSGWNYIHTDLLAECKILTTVDQQVLYANRGLWKVIGTVVTMIQQNGLRTTQAVQESLQLGDSLIISSDTSMITCDSIGYLLDDLLNGYDTVAPPSSNVRVSTGLYDVSITSVTPFEGKFEVNFWLHMEWQDDRLEWPSTQYNGSLPIDPELIWIPAVYYKNENDNDELYQAPAMAQSDGRVTLNTHTVVEFLCPTTADLVAFPFDSYNCSIQLGAPYGVQLDADFGFEIIREDPNFVTFDWISEGEDEDGDAYGILYYELRFERKSFTAWVRFIIPALLINVVGFTSFWIREAEESVALGVTSLLCVLAFRETVETPETSDVNWAEVFLGINIAYQAMVMFIIWCSYGRIRGVAKQVDRFFKFIHPNKVKNITQIPTGLKNMPIANVMKSQSLGDERVRLAIEIPENDMVDPGSSTRMIPPSSNRVSNGLGDTDHSIVVPGSSGGLLSSTFHNETPQSSDREGWRRMIDRMREDSAISAQSTTSFAESIKKPSSHNFNKSFKLKYAEREENDEEADSHSKTNLILEEDTMSSNRDVDDRPRFSVFKKRDATTNKPPDDDARAEVENYNVDWVGRVFIVPSYIIVVISLIMTKWGLTGPSS